MVSSDSKSNNDLMVNASQNYIGEIQKIELFANFNGQMSKIHLYIGYSKDGVSPIHFQLQWLSNKGGMIASEIVTALNDLYKIAVDNGLNFPSLAADVISDIQSGKDINLAQLINKETNTQKTNTIQAK